MRVRYTPRPSRRLRNRDYLRPRNLAAAKRVGSAVEAYFQLIASFPQSDRAQDVPQVRKGVVLPWLTPASSDLRQIQN